MNDTTGAPRPRNHVLLLFVTVVCMSAAWAVFNALLPDFLHNQLGVEGDIRGMLEFPRELPGFLMVVMLGLVAGFPKGRALAIAFSLSIIGLIGMGYLATSVALFIPFMILWSAGTHMYFPLRDALAMELSEGKNRGWILGRVGAVRSLGLVLGTGVVWLCMKALGQGYSFTYGAAAALLVLSVGISFFLPRVPGDHDRNTKGSGPTLRQRFVLRKRYRLYYALAVVFGARKQIFLTFAPWLLVSSFNQRAPHLATAMAVAAVIGLAAKPFFGKMIDRFGERAVLTADGLILLVLCAGYAAVPYLLPFTAALMLLYTFYVSDELLFSLSMARTTYLTRIILRREEMVPTMGLAGTIDHVVSMTVPIGAGLIWVAWGSWAVFSIAGIVAATIAVLARFIPPHDLAEEAFATAEKPL